MPDALEALAERGAHFVLCRADKRPQASAWQKTPAPLEAALQHEGPVGVVPASLGCVVIDVDQGGAAASEAVVATLGQPLARVSTRREGGEHIWYRCRDAERVGNRAWANGDIRGAKGYAILWDHARVAEGLVKVAPVADLIEADIARLPAKRGNVVQLPVEGERNNTLNVEAYTRTRDGLPIEPAIEAARAAGLPEKEIAATVASAVKGAKRAGVRTRIKNPWSSDGLADALRVIGVGVRLNVRARRYEYLIGGEWLNADDERDSWVRQEIARHCVATKGSTAQRLKYSADMFIDLRRALGNNLRIDPFIEFLKALPEWDGQPRIDTLLTDMFGSADDALSKWASRYIGLGAIQRSMEPGCQLDEVPVLLGGQGVGKSHFVRAWFDDTQHAWCGDAVSLAAREKEQAEAMSGRVVVELSELAGLRKAEVETLKSFITRRDDGQHRAAYARATVAHPRMVIFAGTTNSDDCLPNDSSGNRRFVVVELPHGCDVAAASVDRAQWWAEAWTRYHAGERANLPRDLHAEAAERVEAHREVDALEADIRDALHDLPEDGFTIADLYYLLPGNAGAKPADRAMQMRLANGLKNLGFTSHQRLRGGMRARAWSR